MLTNGISSFVVRAPLAGSGLRFDTAFGLLRTPLFHSLVHRRSSFVVRRPRYAALLPGAAEQLRRLRCSQSSQASAWASRAGSEGKLLRRVGAAAAMPGVAGQQNRVAAGDGLAVLGGGERARQPVPLVGQQLNS